MGQKERLEYLIRYLINESITHKDLHYAPSEALRILRSLMSLCMPGPVSREFLGIQDAYLKEESHRRGSMEPGAIPTVRKFRHNSHRFADRTSIWQGDITKLEVDTIVNAVNSQLLGYFAPCHGCINNAIHSVTGLELREGCARIMGNQQVEEPTDQVKIADIYNLSCRRVFHTVGPIIGWSLTDNNHEQLKSRHRSCIDLTDKHRLESIIFCCISTGEPHSSNDEIAEITVQTVGTRPETSSIRRIIFNVFEDSDFHIYESPSR